MEKELLFEAKENATSFNIKEFSPEGAKINITLTGKINGKVKGTIITTHTVLMKPDGTSKIDHRSVIFSNGEPIFLIGTGMGKIVNPAPVRDVEEDLTFQTPSQKLAYLNTTKGWSKGPFNPETGEYNFKVYAVK